MNLNKLFLSTFGISLLSISLSAQVNFTSSKLPIVIIDTQGQEILDEPKITANMKIIWNGDGVLNSISDVPNNYNGKIGIELRGSSSQSFPKKQFGIELIDEAGNDLSASLLGLPEEEDWILFAPYNDKSLMRDVLAYQLGRTFGSYAPRTKYCEVILNGEYWGIYVLIEKIKRDKNRLDINKLEANEVTGDVLTGGYIIKIDKWTGSGGDGWQSDYAPMFRWYDQTIYFQFDYPKQQDIVSAQRNYIRQYLTNFENTLSGPNYTNPENGYLKYMDSQSFIDFFIMNELTKNVDGYRISTFMHKKRDSDGGKLHMGPIWDFNLGFGNADYCEGGFTEGWAKDFNQICGYDGWLIPFWWDRLMTDPAYQQKLAIRWTQLRNSSLSESFINNKIDSMYALLNQGPQQRNFAQWPVLGQYVWPNFYIGQTYLSEVNWLKEWISERLDWMDANMPEVNILDIGTDIELVVDIYPNPFTNNLNINLDKAHLGSLSFELYDNLGQLVFSRSFSESSQNEISISLDERLFKNQSLYHYQIKNSRGIIQSGKLLKE